MSRQRVGSAPLTRRSFFKTSSLTLGAVGLAGLYAASAGRAAEASPSPAHESVANGDTILFQGDSITDAGRSREHAGEAKAELKIYNRGQGVPASGPLASRLPGPETNPKLLAGLMESDLTQR